VKAGVCLLGRLRPILVGADWTHLFVPLGLLTMLVAAVLAVRASELKELLAYSTVSHLGLVVAGFGFAGLTGAETGVFHLLNHATFKASLFLVAGVVAHETGLTRLDELGGLWRDLPVAAAVAVVAALGMGGVPPFNGFYSKELLFETTYNVAVHAGGLAWLYPAVAVLASVFTLVYALRFLAVFFGTRPASLGAVHRPSRSMILPPVVLAGVAAAIGVGGIVAAVGAPLETLESFVGSVVTATLPPGGQEGAFHYALPAHLAPDVAMSAIALAGGVLVFRSWPAVSRLHVVSRLLAVAPVVSPDWWYATLVDGANRASARTQRALWTGRLRTYATWTLVGSVALGAFGYATVGLRVPLVVPDLGATLVVVLAVAAIAALATVGAPSHVAGVLTLAVVGFAVTVFFVLAHAPDVALTQVVVETVTVVVFLLVLDRLPSYYGRLTRSRAAGDAVVALAVGALVTVTTLVATSAHPPAIADYFVANAVALAGGHNVVNVILVDFRGFDTVGEIAVIATSAVIALTLFVMREQGETP